MWYIHRLYQWIYSFVLAYNADTIVDAGADEVILFFQSAGKNACFNLFTFSIRNSEADSWILMCIAHSNAHSNAPFVEGVVTGMIDNLIATRIYSL